MRHNVWAVRHISRINAWMHKNLHHIMRYDERIPYLNMISLVQHIRPMNALHELIIDDAT